MKWYVNILDGFQVTKKFDEELEEMKAYTFRYPELTHKLVRVLLTAQTLWHYAATSEEERWMAKGAANMLKIMKDGNAFSIKYFDPNNPDESIKQWQKYKKISRVN